MTEGVTLKLPITQGIWRSSVALCLLPALAACWFGDPVAYTAIAAYAPNQSRGATVRTVDEAMSAAGFRRTWQYAPYLIGGRETSYIDYERTSCAITNDEDRQRCISAFKEQAVPQFTDEVRTDGDIMIAFALDRKHGGVTATIADHKSGSTVCVEFTQFPAAEFDSELRAGIARLRAQLVEAFGNDNVAAALCGSDRHTPYWPG
jgi:hypothetical protein